MKSLRKGTSFAVLEDHQLLKKLMQMKGHLNYSADHGLVLLTRKTYEKY